MRAKVNNGPEMSTEKTKRFYTLNCIVASVTYIHVKAGSIQLECHSTVYMRSMKLAKPYINIYGIESFITHNAGNIQSGPILFPSSF